MMIQTYLVHYGLAQTVVRDGEQDGELWTRFQILFNHHYVRFRPMMNDGQTWFMMFNDGS